VIRYLYLTLAGSQRDPKVVLFYDDEVTISRLLFHVSRQIGAIKTITFPRNDDEFQSEHLTRAVKEARYIGLPGKDFPTGKDFPK